MSFRENTIWLHSSEDIGIVIIDQKNDTLFSGDICASCIPVSFSFEKSVRTISVYVPEKGLSVRDYPVYGFLTPYIGVDVYPDENPPLDIERYFF
jgi:hypothetical protein